MADDAPAKETKFLIYGVIAVAVLILGYCTVKAVQIGRAAAGMAQRMDTSHQVPSGSAVYLDKTSIAPLTKVVVIHGDTGQASQRSVTAALHHQMVMYTAGPSDSATTARVANMQPVYGLMYGRYDGTDPVRIELNQGIMQTTTLPDGMLMVPGRRQGIPLYQSPTPQ